MDRPMDRKQMEDVGRVLFECLMNRIYSASDFDRLGPMTTREREVIDAWMQLPKTK